MNGVDPTGEVGLVPENYLTLVERIEAIDPNDEAVDWGSDDDSPETVEGDAREQQVSSKPGPPDELEGEDAVTPKPVEDE